MYQGYQGQNQQAYGQPSHVHLAEKDAANLILSELKRICREYATAALEANDPNVREIFKSLLFRSLRDQAELYETLSRQNGYSSGVPLASGQDIQNEMRNREQSGQKLTEFVQGQLGSSFVQAGDYFGKRSYQEGNYVYSQPDRGYPQSTLDQRAYERTVGSYEQTYTGQGYGGQPQYPAVPLQATPQQAAPQQASPQFTGQPQAALPYGAPMQQPQSRAGEVPGRSRQLGNDFAGTPYASRQSSAGTAIGMSAEAAGVIAADNRQQDNKDENLHFGNYIL